MEGEQGRPVARNMIDEDRQQGQAADHVDARVAASRRRGREDDVRGPVRWSVHRDVIDLGQRITDRLVSQSR